MKTVRRKLLVYLLAGFLFLLALCLWSLPWFIEYYLEKNDTEWTGREMEIEDIDINLFTGYLAVRDLQVFEKDGERIFFSLARLEANLEMWSLWKQVIDLDYLMLQSPSLIIEQDGRSFNFDDLSALFLQDSVESEPASAEDPLKYNVRDFTISQATLVYRDMELNSELQVENLNVRIPLVSYEHPGFSYDAGLSQREGGDLRLSGEFNWENEYGRSNVQLTDWTLRPYRNYLNAYLNIRDFDARLGADMLLDIHYGDSGYVASSGNLHMDDFYLVDTRDDSLMTFKLAELYIDSIHTGIDRYDIGHAALVSPQILFKFFESSDNFSQLYVGESEASLDTLNLAERELVFENPFQYVSDYIAYFVDESVLYSFEMDSAVIRNGGLVFQDFSRLEDALIVVDDFDAQTNRISAADSLLKISFESTINQDGIFMGDLQFERREFTNFVLNFDVQDFYLSAFDPYSKHFTAHPLWEGTLNITSNTRVNNRFLASDNRILIMQPEVGKKLDIDTEYNVPLRFAFGLLKDVQGNVDFTFPIEGNLDDPEYKLGPVIIKVIMNLLSKAVASPYKLLARTLDADEEDLKAVRFNPDQDSLQAPQRKSLNLLVRVLENKQDLNAELVYVMNEKEEMDQIALAHAKSVFRSQLPDSLRPAYPNNEAVDNRDSLFVAYLDTETGGMGDYSVAQMSREIMGEDALRARIEYLKNQHRLLVRNFLFEKEMDSTRVAIRNSSDPSETSGVIRPLFMIRYDAMDYSGADSVSGPEVQPPQVLAPPTSG